MNSQQPKQHLVILGAGFGAISLVKRIDLKHYRVTVISPRNHFLFTPLLPSTTAGKIEFRSIIEPVRRTRKGIEFVQAEAIGLDTAAKTLACRTVDKTAEFPIAYDQMVIAVGAWNNTYGIPGVKEHAMFLKELTDARNIRERVTWCLERADVPGITPEVRRRLLHFVVVGGGPTGVEFAAELDDLFNEELAKLYPHLQHDVTITLVEGGKSLLNSFDQGLRDYTARRFQNEGISVRFQSKVKEVQPGKLVLEDGATIEAEVIVWSTGFAPAGFVQGLSLAKERTGRILTDEFMRVPGHLGVYAIGDCATPASVTLPQTAQAAMQQGKYLATSLNRLARGKAIKPFVFNNLGMLAYIGDNRALADIPKAKLRWRGILIYIFWRSAYITRLVSLKNKVLVLFDWFKAWVFGRDLSRF
ncbi:MAG: FAD-dependent oxidoreductase [Armatimonadetes bacterium]|nr:FAD-dependent oxidoreductase [Armatimonadota bacterium]